MNPGENFMGRPYLKYDLVDAISKYFMERGINFTDSFERHLYASQLNKDPLKRTYYGILSSPQIPLEVLKALNRKFELIYLYAGIWDRAHINKDNPIYLNVATALNRGLNCLYKHHYIRKARNKYSRDIKLTQGKEIRRVYKKFIEEQKKEFAKPEKLVEKQLGFDF